MDETERERARREILDPALFHRVRYSTAFMQSAIGTGFLFDLKLNGFDILPDVVGYLFFMMATGSLIPFHKRAHHGQILAMSLVPAGVLEFFPLDLGPVDAIVGLVAMVLTVVLIWFLCQMAADVGSLIANAGLTRSALAGRQIFAVFWGVFVSASALVGAIVGEGNYTWEPGDAIGGGLILLFILAGFGTFFLVVAVFLRASQALQGGRRRTSTTSIEPTTR